MVRIPQINGFGTQQYEDIWEQITQVVVVNSTSDTAANGRTRLRDAVAKSNAYIILGVGGDFELNSNLEILGSNIIFGGETAPDPGVIIKYRPTNIKKPRVVWRHAVHAVGSLKYSAGSGDAVDALNSEGGTSATANVRQHCWVDHVECYYSIDETFTVFFPNNKDFTASNSIFGPPLHNSVHSYAYDHGFGCLVSASPTSERGPLRVDFWGNLFYGCTQRSPRFDSWSSGAAVHNLVYDWKSQATGFWYQNSSNTKGPGQWAVINNLYVKGPNTARNDSSKPEPQPERIIYIGPLYGGTGAQADKLAGSYIYKKWNIVANGAVDGVQSKSANAADFIKTSVTASERAAVLAGGVDPVQMTETEIREMIQYNVGCRPKRPRNVIAQKVMGNIAGSDYTKWKGGYPDTASDFAGYPSNSEVKRTKWGNAAWSANPDRPPSFDTETRAQIRAWMEEELRQVQYEGETVGTGGGTTPDPVKVTKTALLDVHLKAIGGVGAGGLQASFDADIRFPNARARDYYATAIRSEVEGVAAANTWEVAAGHQLALAPKPNTRHWLIGHAELSTTLAGTRVAHRIRTGGGTVWHQGAQLRVSNSFDRFSVPIVSEYVSPGNPGSLVLNHEIMCPDATAKAELTSSTLLALASDTRDRFVKVEAAQTTALTAPQWATATSVLVDPAQETEYLVLAYCTLAPGSGATIADGATARLWNGSFALAMGIYPSFGHLTDRLPCFVASRRTVPAGTGTTFSIQFSSATGANIQIADAKILALALPAFVTATEQHSADTKTNATSTNADSLVLSNLAEAGQYLVLSNLLAQAAGSTGTFAHTLSRRRATEGGEANEQLWDSWHHLPNVSAFMPNMMAEVMDVDAGDTLAQAWRGDGVNAASIDNASLAALQLTTKAGLGRSLVGLLDVALVKPSSRLRAELGAVLVPEGIGYWQEDW